MYYRELCHRLPNDVLRFLSRSGLSAAESPLRLVSLINVSNQQNNLVLSWRLLIITRTRTNWVLLLLYNTLSIIYLVHLSYFLYKTTRTRGLQESFLVTMMFFALARWLRTSTQLVRETNERTNAWGPALLLLADDQMYVFSLFGSLHRDLPTKRTRWTTKNIRYLLPFFRGDPHIFSDCPKRAFFAWTTAVGLRLGWADALSWFVSPGTLDFTFTRRDKLHFNTCSCSFGSL